MEVFYWNFRGFDACTVKQASDGRVITYVIWCDSLPIFLRQDFERDVVFRILIPFVTTFVVIFEGFGLVSPLVQIFIF